MFKIKIAVFTVLIAILGLVVYRDNRHAPKPASQPAKMAAVNYCAGNTEAKKVIVSISSRHMWACDLSGQVYDADVVTGYEGFPETLTPPGSYVIADKMTDQTLQGSDRLGSWNVHVDYWLPFLTNQYGNYGFHDATWRSDTAFGNIDPNSKDASHGCVELPLAAMKWLYGWADTSTAVTVNS